MRTHLQKIELGLNWEKGKLNSQPTSFLGQGIANAPEPCLSTLTVANIPANMIKGDLIKPN